MIRQGKNIYYVDEINDDGFNTKTSLNVNVDGNYRYLPKSILYKAFSFVVYYVVAVPILLIYTHFVQMIRVRGRFNTLFVPKSGYIMYANHTNYSDAFIAPVRLSFPKRTYIIGNKDAIQIPVINILTKALGCLPVPDTLDGLKNLNVAVSSLLKKRNALMIFPEAHIWEYYTGLRPFPLTSFKFAAKNNVPAIPVAITYRRRLIFSNGKPRMCVNIGKPIYPKKELSEKENSIYLRNKVFEYIKSKVDNPKNYYYYNYIKLDSQEELNRINKN